MKPRLPPLIVDRRIGSAELAPVLKTLGARVVIDTLPAADVAWKGLGPSGVCWVGVERKKVSEMLGAMGGNSRFASKQLPRLFDTYHYPWLLIEGVYKCGRAGELISYGASGFSRQRHGYCEFEHFLMTLEQKAGIRIVNTGGFQETCYWIHALYTWWQKRWADHKSAYRIEEVTPDAAVMQKQSLTRRWAAQLDDVYWVRSQAVDRAFPNALAMAQASEQDWLDIDGIGQKRARRIYRAIRGLKQEKR